MTGHTYGSCPTDFTVGQRVALHPATDTCMRGSRYGQVIGHSRDGRHVRVRIDHINTVIRFTTDLLRAIDGGDEAYLCAHCNYGTESEGAISRHYDTAHPDIEEDDL